MHPKLLIVGTVPYNRQLSSRAFESYFKNWEKENLAQIFSNPKEPIKGHCGTLYQITDKRMLDRYFKSKIDTGVVYNYNELKDSIKQNTIPSRNIYSKLYGIGSRKSPLIYLLRKILWKKKYWCTEKLNTWLNSFNPECVFLAFSDDFFILDIALFVAERFNIPIVSCIGDDYYFNEHQSLSPLYHIYKKQYKLLVDKVLKHGGSAAYIGDKIRDKYNEEFSLNGKTVYLSSELSRHEYRPINTEAPFVSYCGNIRLGRAESLCYIASAFGKINKTYMIDVYSNETEDSFCRKLKEHPNIRYHGSIPYEEVKNVMERSDILLIVEGFEKKDVEITRYSLSTKVADSLAIGGAVLTLGSIECGAIEYMHQINCGPVCTSVNCLESEIRNLLFNQKYQRENYDRSIMVTNMNHSLAKSNKVFESIVVEAINNYKK